MAEWVHCNKCYMLPISSERVKYLLTNCGHIFCEKCHSMANNTCYMCKNECSTMVLTSNLDPEIQTYFQNPDEMLQKCVKITDFQKSHRMRLFEHIFKEKQIVENKYTHAKEFIQKIRKQNEDLQKENQQLRNYIKRNIGSPHPRNTTKDFRGTPVTSFSSHNISSNSINSQKYLFNNQTGTNQKKFNWAPNNSIVRSQSQVRTPAGYRGSPMDTLTPGSSIVSSAHSLHRKMSRQNGNGNGNYTGAENTSLGRLDLNLTTSSLDRK